MVATPTQKTGHNHNRIGPNSQAKAFGSLDGRGLIARRLKRVEAEFIEALGGPDNLTPQKRQLIRDTAQIIIRREMVWNQMIENPEGISGESERRWLWLANTIRRNLIALGLERLEPPPPTLADILRGAAE